MDGTQPHINTAINGTGDIAAMGPDGTRTGNGKVQFFLGFALGTTFAQFVYFYMGEYCLLFSMVLTLLALMAHFHMLKDENMNGKWIISRIWFWVGFSTAFFPIVFCGLLVWIIGTILK